jgi:hypothetical protein
VRFQGWKRCRSVQENQAEDPESDFNKTFTGMEVIILDEAAGKAYDVGVYLVEENALGSSVSLSFSLSLSLCFSLTLSLSFFLSLSLSLFLSVSLMRRDSGFMWDGRTPAVPLQPLSLSVLGSCSSRVCFCVVLESLWEGRVVVMSG